MTEYPPSSPVYAWPLLEGDQPNDWRHVDDALLAVEQTVEAVQALASAEDAVTSVNGETGAVVLDAADVGALTEAQGDAAYAALDHTHAWPTAARDFYFSTNTNVSTDPGQGNLRGNTGNLGTATQLAMDVLTNDGLDVSIILRTLVAGDVFLIQDKDQGANWVRFRLTGAPTPLTGYWRLDGTTQATAGSLTTAQLVAVVFYLEGGTGGGGGAVATDPVWDAKGDLAVGTGADTAARLAAGANGTFLTADSAQTTGLAWAANPVTAHAALPNAHHPQAHDHTAGDGSGVLSNEEHDGYSQYANLGADPATPAANRIRLYSKDNGAGVATLYYISESGQVYELPTLTTGGGGGSGAPSNASYVTLSAETKLSAETALGAGVIMSGLLASRPASGTAGRLYLGTDTDLVYRDTGSAWETFATRAAGGAGSYLPLTGGTLTGAAVFQGATSTTNVLQAKLAADTQPRFRADASGKLEWGVGGSTAPDVSVARSGGGQLSVDAAWVPASSATRDLGVASNMWRNAYFTQGQAYTYMAAGTSGLVATAGAVRLPNGAAGSIAWRNAANSADLSLTMNASDHLALTVAAGALTTTVGAAGGASALPATPTGFLTITLNGTARKIPYYAT